MKANRLLTTLLLAALPLAMPAQESDFRQAVSRYAGTSEVTATVTKRQSMPLSKTTTTPGRLTMRPPAYVCIASDDGRDTLMMQGTAFVMTLGGKRHTTDSRDNQQFTTFQQVFEAILSGGKRDATTLSGVKSEWQADVLTLTIRPQKRMIFTSFTLTIDRQTSAITSLRLNGRLGMRMEYTFSDFTFSGE